MAEHIYPRSGFTRNLGFNGRNGGPIGEPQWAPLLRVCPEGSKPIGRYRHVEGGGIEWQCDGELEGYLLTRNQTGTFALGGVPVESPPGAPKLDPKADAGKPNEQATATDKAGG